MTEVKRWQRMLIVSEIHAVQCRQDNNTYPKKLKFCEFIPHKYKLNWDIRMDIRRKRIPA